MSSALLMGVFRPRNRVTKRSACDSRGSSPGAANPVVALLRIHANDRQAPESARIDKPHFPARRQLHDRVSMLGDFSVRCGHLHSARHAEVDDPLPVLDRRCASSCRFALEVEHDVLAYPPDLRVCASPPVLLRFLSRETSTVPAFRPATPTQWCRLRPAGAGRGRWFRLQVVLAWMSSLRHKTSSTPADAEHLRGSALNL